MLIVLCALLVGACANQDAEAFQPQYENVNVSDFFDENMVVVSYSDQTLTLASTDDHTQHAFKAADTLVSYSTTTKTGISLWENNFLSHSYVGKLENILEVQIKKTITISPYSEDEPLIVLQEKFTAGPSDEIVNRAWDRFAKMATDLNQPVRLTDAYVEFAEKQVDAFDRCTAMYLGSKVMKLTVPEICSAKDEYLWDSKYFSVGFTTAEKELWCGASFTNTFTVTKVENIGASSTYYWPYYFKAEDASSRNNTVYAENMMLVTVRDNREKNTYIHVYLPYGSTLSMTDGELKQGYNHPITTEYTVQAVCELQE